MINIENLVITKISAALESAFSDKFLPSGNGIITSEKILATESFPCVSITEESNTVYRRSQDSSGTENHANVMYEIEVFSDKSSGGKIECKTIFKVIDDEMGKMNFTRIMLQPITNASPTLTRFLGRYTGVVDTTGRIYRK